MIFNDLNLTKPCQKGVWGVIKTQFFFFVTLLLLPTASGGLEK